ncbi:TIR domain-containing protein [Caenorhabditis elegans]|uniref:TIR domain-containing protein n=1 Tax=Caenorhabditis elegans TaxID=6239 RepID=H2KMM0_CAEEL|nr:TIR domain-containing protein [Caenorhabditis elegans]CCE71290.2 TIR domain-containing protein [Caenorhabditis elegans]|eukprot:NP_001252265.2 Uncharacterized protein CELE_Y71A12B.17 [Caenorhabditis elegans]
MSDFDSEERPTFDGWSCRLGFMLLTFNLLVITGIATGISNMIRICVDPPECKTGEVYVIIALVIIFLGFIGFLIGYNFYNWTKKMYLPLLTLNRASIVTFGFLLLIYQAIDSNVFLLYLYSISWGLIAACYFNSLCAQLVSSIIPEERLIILNGYLCIFFSGAAGFGLDRFTVKLEYGGFKLGSFILLGPLVMSYLITYIVSKNERKEGHLTHCNSAYRLPHKLTNSLANIAAAQIARHIEDGHYKDPNIFQELDTKSHEAIFSKLLLLNPKAYKFIAKATQIQESVVIGKRVHAQHYYARNIDIMTSLTSVLYGKSLAKIHSLDIGECRSQLTPGWIGTMLPSLQSLDISNKPLSKEDFSQLCNFFQNLQKLNISDTCVKKLQGISKLKNLKVLSMRNLQFRTATDMLDLFKLKGLVALDVSRDIAKANIKTIRQFVECGNVLPSLTFLDASGTDINQDLLDSLEYQPNLQKILAIDTDLQDSNTPKVLNFATLETTLKALAHYTNLKNSAATRRCLASIKSQFKKNHDDGERYDVVNCLKHVIEAIETFSPDGSLDVNTMWSGHTYIQGVMCLTEISINKSHLFHQIDAKLVLEMLLVASERLTILKSSLSQHPCQEVWEAIENLVEQEFDWLDYDRIGKISMRFAFKVGLRSDWFEHQAMPVVDMCTERSPSQDFRDFPARLHTKYVIDLRKQAIAERNTRECMSLLKILHSTTLDSKLECEDILECKRFCKLVWCLENGESDELQLGVLRVIRNIIVVHKSSNFTERFTNVEYTVFQQLLIDWTSNKAYNIFTIIALRIFLTEKDWTPCEFADEANDLLIDRFQFFQPTEITEDLEIYMGTVEKVLKNSKLDGPVLWALLTLQILAGRSKENVWTIRGQPEMLKFIGNPRVASEAVRNATESLLELIN